MTGGRRGVLRRCLEAGGLIDIRAAIESLLRPNVVLDILAHFTLFASDKKKRRLKIVGRYQQYEGANLMVQHEPLRL